MCSGSVLHVSAPPWSYASTDVIAPGHLRLWVKGIRHGDISLNNLMYAILAKTGKRIGIVNDLDLATWVGSLTTNNDRTGTIPFMAIDLLNGGLEDRIPRLYRHDLESFSWVLAYITVADIEYKDCTIINVAVKTQQRTKWLPQHFLGT